MVGKYLNDLFNCMENIIVSDPIGNILEIDDGIDILVGIFFSLKGKNNKVNFIGNGGSAAIASHGALDFWKNCGIRAQAFNDGALLTCIGNDFGFSEVFKKPLEIFSDSGDIVVAISSSGNSPDIVEAARTAKLLECTVITFSGFSENNCLRKLGDINFYVPSDSYGFVELSHQILIHMTSDLIIAKNNLINKSYALV